MSMNNPKSGVIFHSGDGRPMAMDKLARCVIRPAIEAVGLPWFGWHGFRRGVASNLYALGADDKVVQRILRHAKPHVTKDCYIIRSGGAGSDAANASDLGGITSWPAKGQQLFVD